MATMHAVRAHTRGGPEQLVYETAPRPEPGPGEVLVAVRAASITPHELTWSETWTYRSDGKGPERTPIIPSHEFSGVVAAGDGAFATGDEVFGLIPFAHDGAAAEFVALPGDILAAKPTSVDHEHAAAVPLAGLSAWQALVDHANVRRGQRVLVHGAAGGVGTYVVQIAAALGAQVIATAGPDHRDFVARLGAEQVVDYTRERFEDQAHDLDVVVDLVGGETQARSWRCCGPAASWSACPPHPTRRRHGAGASAARSSSWSPTGTTCGRSPSWSTTAGSPRSSTGCCR
jgi:NADPH:quinone reductase-like Zn-dependent oxidoreductase